MSTTYIPTKEINKILRKQLKATYPDVKKFTVTKSHGSIRIGWTDGPSESEVEDATRWAVGETFDGMTDCRDSVRPASAVEVAPDVLVAEALAEHAGGLDTPVGMLSSFVFTDREFSEETIERAIGLIEAAGYTVPRNPDGSINNHPSVNHANDAALDMRVTPYNLINNWSQLIHRLAPKAVQRTAASK